MGKSYGTPFQAVDINLHVPTLIFFDPIFIDADALPKIDSVFYVPAFRAGGSVGIDVVEEIEAWLEKTKSKMATDMQEPTNGIDSESVTLTGVELEVWRTHQKAWITSEIEKAKAHAT